MDEYQKFLFLQRTDRKNVYNKIKDLVRTSMEIRNAELKVRREKLQKLLDIEERQYKKAIMEKVNSRIENDLQMRREALLKMNIVSKKQHEEFVHSLHMQRNMQNCHLIREKIRQKEQKNVSECQIEQVLEKARRQNFERYLDAQWLEVLKKNTELCAEMQRHEQCLKHRQQMHQKRFLDLQIEDKAEERKKQREEIEKEAENNRKLAEETRLENMQQFERSVEKHAAMQQYGNELRQQAESTRQRKLMERKKEASDHCKMMQRTKHVELEENERLKAKKRAFYRDTLEYLNYLKHMRELECKKEQLSKAQINKLSNIDFCTNIQRRTALAQKAKALAEAHAVLKQQIMEAHERRMHKQNEAIENKIIINTFAREEATLPQTYEQRRNYGKELLKQMEDIKHYRAAEELKYEQSLRRAQFDHEYCDKLAEQYSHDAIDYLPAHSSKLNLCCPNNCMVPKKQELYSYCAGPIKPCGCEARWQFPKC